jgi:CHAD domain-containing protein
MPRKSTQKIYLFFHWQGMQRHFYLFLNGGEMNDLHQMRIHIKKINALVLLNAYTHGSREIIRNFKPIKDLFREAGKIRVLHVNLNILKQVEKENSLFGKKLSRQIEKKTKGFLKKRKKWIQTIQNTFPNIDSQISNCSEKRFIRYIKTQVKKAQTEFQKEEFHEARKRIKLVLNLFEFLPKISADSLKLNLVYMDQLQDRIGKWNDLNENIKMIKDRERQKAKRLELKVLTKELIKSKKIFRESAYLKIGPLE